MSHRPVSFLSPLLMPMLAWCAASLAADPLSPAQAATPVSVPGAVTAITVTSKSDPAQSVVVTLEAVEGQRRYILASTSGDAFNAFHAANGRRWEYDLSPFAGRQLQLWIHVQADGGTAPAAGLPVALTVEAVVDGKQKQALSWAAGTIVQKRVRWPLSPLAIAGWQLVLGSVPIALVAVSAESLMVSHASALALWAMAYSAVLSLTVGQYAWTKVVSIFPATIASIGTVAVPVVAAIIGAVLLGESLGWREIIALACVTSAIGLVLFEPARAAPEQS